MLVEQQRKYDALRRENFELKLRLYYLSQELERHGGNADSIDERDLQMVGSENSLDFQSTRFFSLLEC